MIRWLMDCFRCDGVRDDELPPDSDWLWLAPMERLGVQSQDDADIAHKIIASRKRAADRETAND
jgi:hypothetical protein